jgi:RNA polymerase sigma factor (sigma-70 family)
VDIGDGDLVRLARSGDDAAFRLLVERHRAMARARAARLSAHPDDVDDIVQEAFLQAFVALDRLRDPDRFGAWLAGIVRNVYRAAARRAPPTLLADWPEDLHPASAEGLPSAEDLDRAEALRAAVADLPDGQRHAVELYYYADLPARQIAESPGAAKARLHKARGRLREHITAHRPDLIPATSRRTRMTTVRIAHARPDFSPRLNGETALGRVLVVLADDAGHRALPLWLLPQDGRWLWGLFDLGPGEPGPPGRDGMAISGEGPVRGDLTSRLLQAAGVTVTAVDVDELGPEVAAARIEVSSPTGPQQVTAHLGRALALGAAMDAPLRVADALMSRLAVPVTGDDFLGPFLDRRPARPGGRRPGPGNLAFADGLDGWITGGSFQAGITGSHLNDYSAVAADRAAILRSEVPDPYGDAFLGQAFLADDYRGAAVTVRCRVRAQDVADHAEMFVFVGTPDRSQRVDVLGEAITGSRDWTGQEVTAQVPGDAQVIRFGLTLTGPGEVGLRDVEVTGSS